LNETEHLLLDSWHTGHIGSERRAVSLDASDLGGEGCHGSAPIGLNAGHATFERAHACGERLLLPPLRLETLEKQLLSFEIVLSRLVVGFHLFLEQLTFAEFRLSPVDALCGCERLSSCGVVRLGFGELVECVRLELVLCQL
jgi:hypothetical protein